VQQKSILYYKHWIEEANKKLLWQYNYYFTTKYTPWQYVIFFVAIEPFIMELLSFSLQYRLTFYNKNTRSWQHKIFVAIQYFIMQWFSVLLQYTLIPYDVDFCLGSFCLALQSRIIVQFFHLLRCWVGLWFSRCVMVSCPIRCVLTCSGSMLCFEQGVVWWGRLWPLWCVVSLARIS
jgi:hypothetical protein